jgi:hypothetical protein
VIADLLIEPMVNQLIAQGPLALAMAIAIWYLSQKIRECEDDRKELWKKVSEISERFFTEHK